MTQLPPAAAHDIALSKLDSALLTILVKDGRASFADIARQLGISGAHARARVQALQASGVIELFAAVINPERLGQVNSTFIDILVAPVAVERIAQVLADCPEVVSLYIMSDLKSMHVHALTENPESFETFVRRARLRAAARSIARRRIPEHSAPTQGKQPCTACTKTGSMPTNEAESFR